MITYTTYNTAATNTASKILGKECRRKKALDIPDLCDGRRDLQKRRYEKEGEKEYRKDNKRVRQGLKKAKEDWIIPNARKLMLV